MRRSSAACVFRKRFRSPFTSFLKYLPLKRFRDAYYSLLQHIIFILCSVKLSIEHVFSNTSSPDDLETMSNKRKSTPVGVVAKFYLKEIGICRKSRGVAFHFARDAAHRVVRRCRFARRPQRRLVFEPDWLLHKGHPVHTQTSRRKRTELILVHCIAAVVMQSHHAHDDCSFPDCYF